jgi:hypothetical protein
MDVNGHRRAIVILHPDFDVPGKAGVQVAAEYAQQLVKGLKLARAEAQRHQAPPEVLRYFDQFQHLIRVLPGKELRK